MAWILPAISAATALAGLLASKKKVRQPGVPTIDLSAELAKLDALYAAQKADTQARLERQGAEAQRRTAASLAGRGIYSSPVSEYAVGQTRSDFANALADALAQITGQQAGARASLTAGISQLQAQQQYNMAMAKYQAQLENRNRLASALMGAGAAGLQSTDWGKLFAGGKGLGTDSGLLTGKLSLDPLSRF